MRELVYWFPAVRGNQSASQQRAAPDTYVNVIQAFHV